MPVCVTRADLHAYWCNSTLLKLAGINKDTVAPEGGVIEKDENGEITGVLHDSAMGLLKKVFPKLSDDDKLNILKKTLDYFVSLGITSFMDAAASPKNYKIYKKLYSEDKTIIKTIPRCSLSICAKNVFLEREGDETDQESNSNILKSDEKFSKLKNFFNTNRIKNWDEKKDNKFRVNAVKLFIDGVFESGTAMFTKCQCSKSTKEHGVNEHEEVKTYSYSKEELQLIIDYLISNNIQIHSHCIGDIATKMVIDSIFNANAKFTKEDPNFKNEQKNYLAHLQLLGKDEITKMSSNKISANMSPYWFMADSFSPILHSLIGEDRLDEIYPIRYMMDHSILVGFGSDWPVSTLSPLEGIEVAVTHRALALSPDKPTYNPKHLISVYEAVRCYTLASAEILGLDKITGSIEVGKSADIIVLDKNIFKIDPWRIHTANVILTLIDGEIIYKK